MQQTLSSWSRHLHYAAGLEVEFGFATPDWATEPEQGTEEVLSGRFRVLHDPEGLVSLPSRGHRRTGRKM